MRAILDVLMFGLDIYTWMIIVSALMSWLLVFNVLNPRNTVVSTLANGFHQLIEPALRPIRKLVPNLGGVDIAPIILILGIFLVQRIITLYIYPIVLF
jgi:YggT family protein